MQQTLKYLLTSLFITALLLLGGCGTAPPKQPPEPVREPIKDPEVDRALSLMAANDYAAAAQLLETIANRFPSPDREDLLLRSLDAWLQAENLDAAEKIVAAIDPVILPPYLTFPFRLSAGEVAMRTGDVIQALSLLQPAAPAFASDDALRRYHRLRAETFRLSGNPLEAARELSQLDSLVGDPAVRMDYQLAILELLTTLTDHTLQQLQPQAPEILGGWMALARILKSDGQDPALLTSAVTDWRARYPTHPALPELLQNYRERLAGQILDIRQLAVLLPHSGPFAKAASALRDGLITAYFTQAAEQRPSIRFYDSTSASGVWPLYQQALADGADVVIGPLVKEAVEQFMRAGELPVPVLALNRVEMDTSPPSNLYLFGLVPEDEARQAAELAWQDGFTQALVLVPEGDRGDRIYRSFRDRWESLGGILLEHQAYNSDDNDFSGPIQRLLNIDASIDRHSQLQKLLRQNLEFTPHRRDDAQFIFLSSSPQKGRQLLPQLQFHHAADLPIYATSQVFSGTPDPSKDNDIEGIKFPDIPWILEQSEPGAISRQTLSGKFPDYQGPYARLFGMGIDSYNLLSHLPRLSRDPAAMQEGKTGNLYLDDLNQVHRQLIWAQIREGRPQIIGYAPRIHTGLDNLRGAEMAPVDGEKAFSPATPAGNSGNQKSFLPSRPVPPETGR